MVHPPAATESSRRLRMSGSRKAVPARINAEWPKSELIELPKRTDRGRVRTARIAGEELEMADAALAVAAASAPTEAAAVPRATPASAAPAAAAAAVDILRAALASAALPAVPAATLRNGPACCAQLMVVMC